MADLTCPVWQSLLADEAEQAYFQTLSEKVDQARRGPLPVYPPSAEVFRAFQLTPYAKVKVVILGQDPYHQPGQAQGLSFSVPADVRLPPSLRNIYKALALDIEGFEAPLQGDLSSWAEQGVLLLNTVLTVTEGQPHAHAKWGWEQFTGQVLRCLNEHPQPLVFLLWGKHAQTAAAVITDSRHLKLSSVHPSPLSAHRGFFQCGHFSQSNQFLLQQGRDAVDWCSVMRPSPDQQPADPGQKQSRQQKLAW
ncbi:uracil-DNA glycosylase [Aliidiomarina soli]|uniref:Uracil-DNA glycosylase n=2 Tax=Aliidiomarina soli TaxID=1928574 RepID=A0A432WCR5_9GAMM|nr:uracil-DNA glycosylase [Aliidiomarina soli]